MSNRFHTDRLLHGIWTMLIVFAIGAAPALAQQDPSLRLLGTYETNVFDEGAAEIAAFDAARDRVFFVNADAGTVDVLDLDASASPTLLTSIDVNTLAENNASSAFTAGGANSVAVAGDLLAVAVEADPQTDLGVVVFIDLTTDLTNIPTSTVDVVEVGALPDGIAFTPDGSTLIVANEGEPDDGVDPEGSISLVNVTTFGVTPITFDGLTSVPDGVRIIGTPDNPTPTIAEDLEPEFPTATNTTAYVTLQENNALAVVDLNAETVSVLALGYKDHSSMGNGIDASDEDGAVNIQTWPVFGMYQPDAIAAATIGTETVLVTANEGDARDFEEARVAELVLDPTVFTDPTLQDPDQLGRLEVTNTLGINETTTAQGITASLDADQSVGNATGSSDGEGFSTIYVSDDPTDGIAYRLTVEGLDFGEIIDGEPFTEDPEDDVTILHIHGQAARGSTAPVAFGIVGPNDDNDPDDRSFAVNADGSVTITGVWDPSEGQDPDGSDSYDDFRAALDAASDGDDLPYYWNVHTEGNPAGEIRGQLVAAPVYDELYVFGARSFSTWNGATGALRFDSGDDIEQRIAAAIPDFFNSNNDENDSFDSRSDAKGPEPEAIAIGAVDGTTYAFVGLERVGGVMVFDITDPDSPTFVEYLNNRNFLVSNVEDAVTEGPIGMNSGTAGAVGDLGPESITFVPGTDSPTGENLVIVSNEISGTVSLYAFAAPSDYTLQLLHASDLESPTSAVGLGGTDDIGDAPRFSGLVNVFRDQYANTLLLSSGDNVLPTPLFNAGGNAAVEPVVGDASPGRADIAFMNLIGFDGSTVGNHEFDQGTDRLASLLETDGDYTGTRFPYLSVNLDFGPNGDLSGFSRAARQGPAPNSLTPSSIYTVGGEEIGVVGVTTPELASVSSPGNVVIAPADFDPSSASDLDALAQIVQNEVDALTGDGVNKIIVVMHLQEFNIDEAIVSRLTDVDVVISGGSDRLLADGDDVLRTGDTAEDTYPLEITDATGTNDVVVVSTDGQYRYLGRLIVTFNSDGIVTGTGPASEQGAYATTTARLEAVAGDTEANLIADDTIDPDVLQLAGDLKTVLETQLANTFGETAVFLNGIRDEVRTEETNLGNLSADANLAYAKAAVGELGLAAYPDVDVSLKNGGGIRAPIGEVDPETGDRLPPQAVGTLRADGEVSQLDIASSLAFDNSLTLLTLTPAQFKEALENGVSRVEDGAGRFPQIAGFTFSFDVSRLPGDRVRDVTLDDATPIIEDGAVAAGAPDVRLVTLGFLAGGGDGYTVFETAADPVDLTDQAALSDDLLGGDGTNGIGDKGAEQDAFSEYVAATFPSGSAYAEADTDVQNDTRILNLTAREGVAGVAAWINEFHYDNDGADEGEFIEVAVEAGFTSLSDLEVVLYNGSNGEVYDTRSLDTYTEGDTDPSGNFTLYVFNYTDAGGSIQNGGPDGIALCFEGVVVGNADPVTRQFLSYEGDFTAAEGCAQGLTSTDIGVSEGSSTSVGASLALDGTGTTYADLVGNSWTVAADDTPGALNANQVLPVELASFTAAADVGAVVLRWQTTGETNNAGFRVEHRAPDASSFRAMSLVTGAGTTTEVQQYSFRVNELAPGDHAFRLRQIDVDGASRIVGETNARVGIDGPYALSEAYPNPVRQRSKMDLMVREAQTVSVELYNLLGQRVATVFEGDVTPQRAVALEVDARRLSSGVYFARVKGETFTTVRKMVVVR